MGLEHLTVFKEFSYISTYELDRCTLCARAVGGKFGAWLKGEPMYSDSYQGIGRSFSYDWCRFRRMQHCWRSGQLNEPASKQAGYAVWVPVDQGFCPRQKWDAQMRCPIAQPGPHATENRGFTDATVAWEDGGQRDGVPSPIAATPAPSASAEPSPVPETTGIGEPREMVEEGSAESKTSSRLDPLERLERLEALQREGALSESEFQAAKKRILADL